MNLDAVQMAAFVGDPNVMAGHTNNIMEDSVPYETAYSYDELFPSLPEMDFKPEAPQVDMGQWNQKMKLKTSVITQVFHVPVEERKFRDMNSQRFGEQGEQAKICADIMQKTSAHIEISSSKDQSLTILVTGKEEAVLKARRLIVKELQTQASIAIPIPKEHHRFILGKSGKKLADLELSTATKITVPRPDENSDLIKITGTKEGIDRARHEIQLISDEQAKLAFERLDIPKIYHSFISGPFQETVNQILNETGARINIPPPSVIKDEITIAGEKEAVAQAKERVLRIYEDKKRNCQVVSVEVPKNQHKYVIGYRGQTIQEILAETGVSVEMPSPDSQIDTITLRGEQDKLGPALTLVYSKANSVKTSYVDAPSWLHKFIIGRKGANIKQMTQDLTKVHVEFTNDQDKIRIEGPPEEVMEACRKLKEMTQDLLSRIAYEELSVDPRYHRHIIGKSGANINRLKQETGVLVHIPPDSESNGVIRIEGNPAGVAQAKKELLEMVHKMENEVTRELIIEQRFHRNIIGAKGENIKEVRDRFNQVNVTFPEPGHKSDKVLIRGPKQDVDDCYKYLAQKNNELKITNFQVEVPIYKQNHKFIIGKGGANIKRIRDETSTKIDLPAEGAESDVIKIVGRREDVLAAQAKILSIQEELDNIVSTDIFIPAKFHNSIIGSKGRLIRSIMEECGGVTIKFPAEGSGSDKVSIRGVKEDVQKAKKLLLELSNEKQITGFTEEVKAKPEHHKFLIGKSGANIKKVRDKTGARVIFPTEKDDDKDTITIIGRKEEVLAAKEELFYMIKELEKTVEATISVDPKHHRHFLARRNGVLKQITDEFDGVTVSFPRSGVNSSTVVIKGIQDCVEGAKKRIEEIAAELDMHVTIQVVIAQQHHRTLMGAKGHKIQSIIQEHNVQIKFPDRNNRQDENAMNGDCNPEEADPEKPKKCDIIIITGRIENCEAAKQALLDNVPVSETMEVPYDLHRFIIGQGGKDVRNLMETYDVNITIPSAAEQSDLVVINGPPANVQKAKAALVERIEKLEEEKQDRLLRSFQLTVEVDSQYHPKIIGRGGAIITKIRKDNGVQISFPERDDPEKNIITITGYEKNAHAAKDDILKIVQEQEEMAKQEVRIDHRVHSRLIGTRGRSILKIMDDYKVDIRFPRSTDPDPDLVVVSGADLDVQDAVDHLLLLEEEFLQDIIDKERLRQYTLPPSKHGSSEAETPRGDPRGFVVTGAPWDKKNKAAPDTSNTQEFPSFGTGGDVPTKPVAWGPSRR